MTSIAEICRENVSILTSVYVSATGASMEITSKRVYGNRNFIRSLLKGDTSISVDKLDVVIGRFRELWPERARWPILRVISIAGPGRRAVPANANQIPAIDAPKPKRRKRRARARAARPGDGKPARAARKGNGPAPDRHGG